jgi:hypothetical protein
LHDAGSWRDATVSLGDEVAVAAVDADVEGGGFVSR